MVLSDTRSSQKWLLGTCCAAVFTDIFVYGVLAPVLPFALPGRAHVPPQDVQKYTAVVIALGPATTVVTAPFAGWVSDRCRRRQPLFMSALLAQAAAIGCFTAGTSLALWLVGSIIVGLSSAIVWASSLAMILDRVPKKDIGQFLGYMSSSLGLGIFLGPILGGVLWEHGGPYGVWALCFGFVAIDAVLRLLVVEKRPPKVGNNDVSGEEKASFHVLSTVQMLKSPRLLCALWSTIAQATVLSSFDGSLTIFAKDTFDWSSTAAGLLYIPFVIPSFLCPVVGAFADRRGGRYIAASGFLLVVIVLVCLRFVENRSISQKILLCALLFLVGLFLGSTIPIFSSEIANVVFEYEEKYPGVYHGTNSIAQAEGMWWAAYSIGATCGPLWGGFVQEAAGWKVLTWTLALLSGVTVVPVLMYTDGSILKLGEGEGKQASSIAAENERRDDPPG